MYENDNYAITCKKQICTIKSVQELFSPAPSASWASKQIQIVRDALNKPRPQIITIEEFCSYFGL